MESLRRAQRAAVQARHATGTDGCSRGRRRGGLTLLELIVVIVILAILSAIAIPTFISVITQTKDQKAAVELTDLGHIAWANAALSSGTSQYGYTDTNVQQAAGDTESSGGGLSASGTGVLADGVGSDHLAWDLVDAASNEYLQVEAGLQQTSLSDSASQGLQLAMLSEADHCVIVTFSHGNLTPASTLGHANPEILDSPSYTDDDGDAVVGSDGPCQVDSSNFALVPPPTTGVPGGGGGTPGGSGGTESITLSGTAGNGFVTLDWGALADATSYGISCPQLGTGSSVSDYGTVTSVTPTGSIGTPSDAADGDGSGTYSPIGSQSTGTELVATVEGLQNFIVADCTVVATTSSTPVTSNTVALTPTAPTQPTTCGSSSPVPASGSSCSTIGEPPPPPATIPPGTPPTPTTYAPGDLASLQESNDHSFPHYPLVADPTTGAVYQVDVTGDGTGSARVLYPAGSFTDPTALLGGTFVTEAHSVVTSVFYLADAGTGDIWRIDPGSFVVDGSSYTPPVKVLVASGLSGVSALAGFACYTSGDTPQGAVDGVPQECLYAVDSAGLVRISLNDGSVTSLSSAISGGATGMTLVDGRLNISYGDNSVRFASPYDGSYEEFQSVPGGELEGLANSDIAPSEQTWDAAVGLGVSNTSSIAADSSVLYTDSSHNIVGAIDGNGNDVVIAGGGGTPVTTQGWTSCADAQLDDPVAVNFHGPEGMLFLAEAGNGNFDMLETDQYTSPDTGPNSSCRIKALFSAPVPAGKTWTTGTSLPAPSGWTSYAYAGTSCSGTSTCVAAGYYSTQRYGAYPENLAAYSTDGGVTWTQASIPAGSSGDNNIQSVACPTATHCVAIGRNDDDSSAYVNSNTAYYSNDGGATWTAASVPTDAVDSNTGNGPYGNTSRSVSCSSASDCMFLDAYTYWDGSSFQLWTHTFTSTDGGVTWTQGADLPAGVNLSTLTCAGSRCMGVGVAADSDTSYSTSSAVYSTTDDGATWTSASALPSNFIIFGAACSSSTHCILDGLAPEPYAYHIDSIEVTDDGGATWSSPTLNVSGLYWPGQISCSGSNCVVVGGASDNSNQIYPLYTTDGGTTWSNGEPEIAGELVSCSSGTQCTAIGSGIGNYGTNFVSYVSP